jgi:hypothetical protein
MAHRWQRESWILALLGLAGSLATSALAQEEPTLRRVGNTTIREFRGENTFLSTRGRALDERLLRGWDRSEPRFSERDTHRGAESRQGIFSVLSASSAEEAAAIRGQLTNGWQEITRLLGPVDTRQHEPDFAHAAVQVIVNARTMRGEQSPAAIVSYHGPEVVIHLPSRDPAGEAIADQARSLERNGAVEGAAAQAFLQLAKLDQVLPSWATQGLASYVAEQATKGQTAGEEAPLIATAKFNSTKLDRSQPATLEEYDPLAREKVTFLLQGNDGSHAIEFLQAIQASVESAAEQQASTGALRENYERIDSRASADVELTSVEHSSSPVDALFDQLQPQFEQWQQDTTHQEPIIRGPKLVGEEAQVRDELLVVLKLQQRYWAHTQPASMKIVERNQSVSQATHVTIAKSSKFNTRPPAMTALHDFLTNPEQPQAVVDADGALVLPHETEKLEQLLGLHERRYSVAWQENRWVMTTRLNGVQELRGWLEENPDNSARPLAQFAVVKRR